MNIVTTSHRTQHKVALGLVFGSAYCNWERTSTARDWGGLPVDRLSLLKPTGHLIVFDLMRYIAPCIASCSPAFVPVSVRRPRVLENLDPMLGSSKEKDTRGHP